MSYETPSDPVRGGKRRRWSSPPVATPSSDDRRQSGDTKPIVIGAAVAQSGGFELYDDEQTAGMQFAIDKINAAGGIDGRKLELIIADHKTDPAQVEAAAQERARQGRRRRRDHCGLRLRRAGRAGRAARRTRSSIGGAGAPEFGLSGLGPAALQRLPGHADRVGDAVAAGLQPTRACATRTCWRTPASSTRSRCVPSSRRRGRSSPAGHDRRQGHLPEQRPVDRQPGERDQGGGDADFVVLCSYPPGGASAIRQLRTAGRQPADLRRRRRSTARSGPRRCRT